MKTILRASAALAAGVASLSIACVALSQAPQPEPNGPPTAEQRQARMHERMQEEAQRLHALLNLRPDQEAAFQAFQAAMAPQPHERGEHRDHAQGQLTTPERLDRMADRMAKHEADFRRKAEAIRAFYAVLSPEQQRAFDALPMPGGRGEHGDHGDHNRGPRGPEGATG
ncbi:MAG TPA: Spy/CpxP family protein refolding chaperone [Caulobacteraceae bacterium]|nr:Spy/CpxP family protein refolding chaperone [Caulobacteraceae bacterium]